MSNNINSIPHDEQSRHAIRVSAGKGSLTGDYSVVDIDDDGRTASKQYVWDTGTLQWVAMASNGAASVQWNTIEMSYTGSNLTGVVYKLNGVTQSTLALTYDGSNNLTGVTRS